MNILKSIKIYDCQLIGANAEFVLIWLVKIVKH